jgi:hypothetical protein
MQDQPIHVLTTVATFTCEQLLCNASAVAETFMGFAWKVASVMCSDVATYQYPTRNATADQCRLFAQVDAGSELLLDAQAGCRSRLVGSMSEEGVSYRNAAGNQQINSYLTLNFRK